MCKVQIPGLTSDQRISGAVHGKGMEAGMEASGVCGTKGRDRREELLGEPCSYGHSQVSPGLPCAHRHVGVSWLPSWEHVKR